MSTITKTPEEKSLIKDVYADNFEKEMKKISRLIERFPCISMDTEFPGIVHQVNTKSREAGWKNIKLNVDELKLIQCGITLSDDQGNIPNDICTWQFNFNFDMKTDNYSNESIILLTNSGINFDKIAKYGISSEKFGEVLMTSGLVLNEDVKWISFHGSYDFAYLIRLLTNQTLPESENDFFDLLKTFFPTFYDIRHLTKHFEGFSKSLQKLAQELEVIRIGTQHQAGSDSIVTSKVFHKLNAMYINPDQLKSEKNVLYGLGLQYQDEQNTYGNLPTSNYMNMNFTSSFNNKMPNYDMNHFYHQQYPFQQQQQFFNRGANPGFNGYNFQYSNFQPQQGAYGMPPNNDFQLSNEEMKKKTYN